MGSNPQTLQRMRERVSQLCKNFVECLDFFENSETFVGPSFYFHCKALSARKRHMDTAQLLQSDEFFDWLYATLTAWGLHRMGPGNAKLRDIEELKSSFRSQVEKIRHLEALSITRVSEVRASELSRELWGIISNLRVSIAEAQIVANSKALHHVLPALVPPIDRSYTFNFFYSRNMLSVSEAEAFREMYLQFYRIATLNRELIQSRIGKGWNTSETKVIDNAIVGYVLKNLR